MQVRVRWAPSPTGSPHVGNASVALYDYVLARASGGDFILRIEDTDRVRSTKESEQAILECLDWLGLRYDEGPGVGGPHAPYRQSERTAVYARHVQMLLDGGHAYHCFCTPEQVAQDRKREQAAGRAAMYARRCRRLSPQQVKERLAGGEPHTIRLKVPLEGRTRFHDYLRGEIAFDNAVIDDQVLLKSDGYPTYHLANVVDDHLMQVTHVLRGEEWISSTPKHVLLYQAFGWTPPTFVHLSILRDRDRRKLSKRDGTPTGVLQYRDAGYLPEAIINFLALMSFSMSDEREQFTLDELIRDFSLDRLKTTAPVFDTKKLLWLNGEYIRGLPSDSLIQRLRDVVPLARELETEQIERALPLVRERMKTLMDFEPVAGFLFTDALSYDAQLLVPKKCDPPTARLMLQRALDDLVAAPEWVAAELEQQARRAVHEQGWKAGPYFMCLRVAVTGATATPPLFQSMELLGRDQCVSRVRKAMSLLGG